MVCNISAQMWMFFGNFLKLKGATASKITKPISSTKRHCVSRMKLFLTSGEIEWNPGPEQNLNSQTILSVGSSMMLNLQLCQRGLGPVNVSGEDDCCFRSVSQQLYDDPNYHLLIRRAGVQYLSNNHERVIESNTENSWNEYISLYVLKWRNILRI